MHSSLTCAACGKTHAVDELQNLCSDCQKPLLAGYDLDSLKERFTPGTVRARLTRSMWRFHEVLPVADVSEAVSLGEGQTPLIQCQRRGPFAVFPHLFVKDEAFNPTGSFKPSMAWLIGSKKANMKICAPFSRFTLNPLPWWQRSMPILEVCRI